MRVRAATAVILCVCVCVSAGVTHRRSKPFVKRVFKTNTHARCGDDDHAARRGAFFCFNRHDDVAVPTLAYAMLIVHSAGAHAVLRCTRGWQGWP